MHELNREIVSKVESLLKRLEAALGEAPSLASIYNKFSDLLRELSRARAPHVYTRELFNRYVDLFVKVEDTARILDRRSEHVVEELVSQLEELLDSFQKYVSSLKKVSRRERILLNLPLYSVLLIYVVNAAAYYVYYGPELAAVFAALPLIALASIALSRSRLDVSYALLSASAALGIGLTVLYGRDTAQERYNVLLYTLIIITSISYFQTSRVLRARVGREKVASFLESLAKASSDRRQQLEEEALRTRELEERALSLFKRLYGEDGEKLFNYKLNVLLMHGLKREEALRRILSQAASEAK